MKEFSPFVAPFQFYKGDLYRDVATRWGGIGFQYLFVMVVLIVSLQTVRSTIDISTGLVQNRKMIEDGFKDLPVVEIKNGIVKIDKPCPYTIRGGTTLPVVIIDTSGGMKTLTDAESYLKSSPDPNDKVPEMPKMFVTSDTIFMRQETGEVKTLPVSQLNDMTISRELVTEVMNQLPFWCALICITGAIACVFPSHLFIAMIYGLCCLIMANVTGAKLNFSACMRLAAVAMSPSIMLSGFVGIISGGVLGALYPFCPVLNFVSIPLTLGFLYFAAASCSEAKLQNR